MVVKIEIPEELVEKLSAEDTEGYVRRVLKDHAERLEGVSEATSKDPYLLHLFIGQLENPEDITKAIHEQSRAEGRQLERGEVFTQLWKKLGPKNRLTWAHFVKKWSEPFYQNKTLGELAKACMMSKTDVEFAGLTGLSYGIITKTIKPKLIKLGIPRMIIELFDYRYLHWKNGKPKR